VKLYSLTGRNPSGVGLWTHNLPADAEVMPSMGGRMFVHSRESGDYFVLEDGTTQQHAPYRARLHEDND
jgi:hypothetical protein